MLESRKIVIPYLYMGETVGILKRCLVLKKLEWCG